MEHTRAFAPVFAFAAGAFLQVLSCRSQKGDGLLRSVFTGFGAGAFVLFLFETGYICRSSGAAIDTFGRLAANAIIYLAFWNTYFHFLNMGETARRIRILRELYSAPGGLTLDEIISRYNAEEIIGRRLSRLVSSGQIALKNGKYYIGSPFMLFAANGIMLLKTILFGKIDIDKPEKGGI